MTAAPTKYIDRHWRCDCGSGHFMTFTWWPDELPRGMEVYGYLNVEGDFWTSLRGRIGQAWRVLRGGHTENRVGVALSPVKAREIAAALTEYATSADGTFEPSVAVSLSSKPAQSRTAP